MNLDSSVCRACLLSDSKGYSIQQKTDLKEYTFLEMFNACTHLEALEFDDFPQFICQSCSNDLQIAFDFLVRAAASDQFFKDQHEVKREVEYYYLSDEKNQEEIFFEENYQIENQDEELVDHYEEDNVPEALGPVKCEFNHPENVDRKQGFDKQFEKFVEGELAFECIYVEPNGDSTHASDAGIIATDHNYEMDANESKSPTLQMNSELKTYKETKNRRPEKEDQSVECLICGKFLKQMSIKHHLKRCQKEEKLHLCSTCPKSFAIRADLKNHMRTHDKERERRYVCSECGKGFFEKQSLKVHITRHMGYKEYHCKICPKQFTTKKSLDVHVFTHNRDLGRFVCRHCEKRFPSKADLTVHERFHTGDYPFQCEFCGKSYAVKSHYNYHMAKHKGITYKCDQCDKEFINRGSLTAHKFKHNERMPHECSICKKGFASPYKLNRHKSCHKPNEDDVPIK